MKTMIKMKNIKNVYLSVITLLIAFIIIALGYRSLDVAGNYFILSNNEISTFSTSQEGSYVFYSQSDSEIVLFPWNYYEESVPPEKLYTNTDEEFNINNYLDLYSLYLNLEYYFYQMAPESVIQYLSDNNIYLYTEMNFNSIAADITGKSTNTSEMYFFYKKELTFNNDTYIMSFAFNEFSDIYSFQFKPVYPENTITKDVMTNGSNFLKLFLGEQETTSENLTEEYEDFTSADSSVGKVLENEIALQEKNETKYTTSNSSYQIIETEDELLLVSINDMTVYYFDPVQNKFTGFNFIE